MAQTDEFVTGVVIRGFECAGSWLVVDSGWSTMNELSR